jgi:anti-sigma regulatory factor (Ser/Thr protein kinase)
MSHAMKGIERTGDFARGIESLDRVFALADEFFSSAHVDPSHRYAVNFALEELFTNFVKYNATGRSDISVRLAASDDDLTITMTDHDCDAFDVTCDAPAVDIDRPLAERAPGGLGLHLVRNMVDRIDYAHADRTGTITLHKNLR